MRLSTVAEGPALLSRFNSAHVVPRHNPRTLACLAIVSHPADTKASRISATFETCLAFARRLARLSRTAPPSAKLRLVL
jgi:hypothetical protein